jgi:hypothetical protein
MDSASLPQRALAPLALFVYRRTDLLNTVLDALEACPEFPGTPVFIYSDGPKNPKAEADVLAVRDLVRGRLRANMTLIESPENKGLSRSIISGVSDLCERYQRVIVMEDDLIVSPIILTWFNDLLDRFEHDERIMQISGHMFDSPKLAARNRAIAFPMATSWGWATWDRAWNEFDEKATGWEVLKQDRALRRRFDLDGVYPYYRMLRRQMAGEIDSWAIRWNWTLFKAGGLTVFPPRSLVANDGLEGGATHPGFFSSIRKLIAHGRAPLQRSMPEIPDPLELDSEVSRAVRKSVWRATSKLSFHHWVTR